MVTVILLRHIEDLTMKENLDLELAWLGIPSQYGP